LFEFVLFAFVLVLLFCPKAITDKSSDNESATHRSLVMVILLSLMRRWAPIEKAV
jgi:hypothetical protein